MIKVLYVDDELDLLDLAKEFLSVKDGFDVETVVSVKEAIKFVQKNDYEVIISDYEMPEISGIEFLKIIRKRFKNIPFILFTGKGREEVAIEAINNGVTFYLQKGTDVSAMFAELKQKIKQGVEKERLSINLSTVISSLGDIVGNEYVDIEKILKTACKLLKADAAYAAFIDGKKLKGTQFFGITTAEFKNMVALDGYGIGWRAIIDGEGKVIGNYLGSDKIDHNAMIDNAVKKEGIISVIAVPIISPVENLGALYLFTRRSREFSGEDLELVSFFGSLIGIRINREERLKEQEKLKDSLIEINKKLNLMSSNVRHAFNNQITGINCFLDLILETTQEEVTKGYALEIQKSVNEMIVDSKNARIYQNVGINNPQWHSIIEMENYFSKRYPNLSIVNNAKDLEIYADPLLLAAMENLVVNTMMHGVKATTVALSYRILSDKSIIFYYEDNGIGIKNEEKEKIFNCGFGKNTGLGLFMVREIMTTTKMEIKETGEFGKGVRFEVLIPAGAYRRIK